MKTETLAYKVYEWRKKYRVDNTPQHDWKVAEYILRIRQPLPAEADWRGWDELFRYHHGV